MDEYEKEVWKYELISGLITAVIPIVIQHLLDVRKEKIAPPEKKTDSKSESFVDYVSLQRKTK